MSAHAMNHPRGSAQPDTTAADRDEGFSGRVLVVTHLFPTGPRDVRGPWVAEQVDALAQLGDVGVLCCSYAATNRSETRPSGVRVTFRAVVTRLGVGRAGFMASAIFYYRALHRYLRRDPSVAALHAHFGFPDSIVVYLATRRSKRPFVVTLHGDDAYRVLPRRDPFGWLARKAVSRASAVICVSDAIADAVRSICTGVDPVVISNGYDDALFRISDIPRDLGLLFVGTLVPVKNLATLLRAYASIVSRVAPDLTIVGEGTQRSELESLVDELGLGDRVHFVGALERQRVADMMQRAVALLLPSQSEGWPLVVGEALACGTPVVASRVGGIPEILASEDGGILVEPGDEHGLAEALIAILERPNDPRRVAAASRAQPWSVQAERIAAIYREALDGRIAAAPPRVAS